MAEYRRFGAILATLEPLVEEVTTTPYDVSQVGQAAVRVEAAQATMSAFVKTDTEAERVRRMNLALSAG